MGAPALAWTPSPRVLTLPLRDMSHTTDTDTTLTVPITTERGLLMPRPRLRLIPLFCTHLMEVGIRWLPLHLRTWYRRHQRRPWPRCGLHCRGCDPLLQRRCLHQLPRSCGPLLDCQH